MGPALLNYVSPSRAHELGVDVRAGAVVDGEHTFFMIVNAADAVRVHEFVAPFAAAGSVDVQPASTCEQVVQHGGCTGMATAAASRVMR